MYARSCNTLRLTALALVLTLASPLANALPGPLKPGHPRLFTSNAGIAALKQQIALPLAPGQFPQAAGKLSFEWTPQFREPGDAHDAVIFGQHDRQKNAIFMRHNDAADNFKTRQIGVQFGFTHAERNGYLAQSETTVSAGEPINVTITWNSHNHTLGVRLHNSTRDTMLEMDWPKVPGEAGFRDWQPDGQIFQFLPRQQDGVARVELSDEHGHKVLQMAQVDVPLNLAWRDLLAANAHHARTLQACRSAPNDGSEKNICNVATGHRITIMETAQELALAYLISGSDAHLQAALAYLDRLLAVQPGTGAEWSMGGRVAAMGILYDWLYAELGSRKPANQSQSYRSVLAQAIKTTIAAPVAPREIDLVGSVCGAQELINTPARFACRVPPMMSNWQRSAKAAPGIAPYYISGHPFSAIHAMSMGLLAIADEHPETHPLLDTIWQHLTQGFLPVQAKISVDGGQHTGYAYGVSAIPERVLLWNSALAAGSHPLLAGEWQHKLYLPYLYALLPDHSYPARGDDFGKSVGSNDIARLALWAANQAGDTEAWRFYRQQIVPARKSFMPLLFERLFWPVNLPLPAENLPPALPLARQFRSAGSVVLRDSWQFANATVLDFKSANFVSENHQHFDQNSFSLYYKTPLLLDSGEYDDYGSPHWHNYYTRSIAHNTLTVFDPTERFFKGEREFANDGGQWLPDRNIVYPTPEEIAPGGLYALDGVTRFEQHENYTYVRANASRAYQNRKLDANDGFIRNIVFLRHPTFWPKPVTLVFDTVHAAKPGLTTTLHWHPANEPVLSGSGLQAQGNGRYAVQFAPDAPGAPDAPDAPRGFTVRNGAGMLGVQILLPEHARMVKVGGMGAGSTCQQVDPGLPGSSVSPQDCRYTVQQRQADGSYVWRNFPVRTDARGKSPQPHSTAENGVWRLEISAPDAGLPQQSFLHVLSVQDNDQQAGKMAAMPQAMRLKAAANTEAVLLGNQIVVFGREVNPQSLGWHVAKADLPVLATGLVPDTEYRFRVSPQANGFACQLTRAAGNGIGYRSSAQGVIEFRP
jgi:hypothetical protein